MIKVQLIVVDVETNGLDHARHDAVEVAWHNLATGERDEFVPVHDVHKILQAADVAALRVNRYIDRLATAHQDPAGPARLYKAFGWRWRPEAAAPSQPDPDAPLLALGAVNPAFDAGFLSKLLVAANGGWHPAPWDYRVRNLADYAAGALGLPLNQRLPSMHDICDLFGIAPGNHSAADDVRALGECFLMVEQLATASDVVRAQLRRELTVIQTSRQREQAARAQQ